MPGLTPESCRRCARELLQHCLSGTPWPERLPRRLVDGDCSGELFGLVVERLADQFDPAFCEVYARLFSGILAYVHPGLDASALLARYRRMRQPRVFEGGARAARRIVVLSRVTLGADIAVTSVILDGLKERFPEAEILLAGGRKSHELFAADPRIGRLEVSYPRTGDLRFRLAAWPALQRALPAETDLVVDPDSRLTQLGLLPLCPEERYFFFESRSAGGEGPEPLPVLASRWVEKVFGVSGARPYIAPRASSPPEGRPVISISLGVGENPLKRMADPFEERLLRKLAETGAVLNIDSGSGGEEAERVARAVSASGAQRVRCFSGSFADFAAQIAASDLYVGYDSAGQHAAAAAGVPLVTVFAGQVCERMFHRWRPAGEGPVEIVKVEGQRPEEVLERAAAAAERLLARATENRRAACRPRRTPDLRHLERIAVVRALPGWGDMLCAVPALRALRAAAPRARITLIGLTWARAFAARFAGYIDGLLEFPGYPGIPLPERPDPRRILAFLEEVRRESRFDLAVQMHGSGIASNPFTALLGARFSAGFYVPGHYCPDSERFLPYPDDQPEVRRNLRLASFLGAAEQGEELEFPILEEDRREARAAAPGLSPGNYVCLHPGARSPARRWLPERFAAVADSLAREGLRVMLTGSRAEQPVLRAVMRHMTRPAAALGSELSFGGLAALIGGARLVVANDTGVSHVAAALGIPSVIVFTAADPKRWAPLDGRRHRALYAPVECRPCDHEVCPIGHPCAAGVSVEQVLVETANLLHKELAFVS